MDKSKVRVEIKKLTDWSEVLDAARFTVNKKELEKEPSSDFKRRILMAEHSPIRSLIFVIKLYNVPTWVSQHIARHDVFAGHNTREGAADTHYVATQRSDRTGVDRSKLSQEELVDHRILLNAQDFIIISRKRLCNCASPETRFVWEKIKEEVEKIEPELASRMVRECIYRGFCPEMKCCGYSKTKHFSQMLEEYRKIDDINKDGKKKV